MQPSVTSPPGRRASRPNRFAHAVIAVCLAIAGAFALSPAGNAAAQEATPGTILLTNTLTTTDYEAYVDGSIDVDLERGRAEREVEIAPGTHEVSLYTAGQDPSSGSPLATRTVDVPEGGFVAFVVHPTASGTVATSVFDVDSSKTGSAEGRITVRHLAEVGSVDVTLEVAPESQITEGTTDAFTLSNGQQGVITDVAARENLIYRLTAASAAGNIVDTEVTLQPGEHLIVNIGGNPPTIETAQDPQSFIERLLDVGALPPPAIWLVNGFTMQDFDFYVDGTVSRTEVEPLRRSGQLQGNNTVGDPIPAGEYTVEVYADGTNPTNGSPVATTTIDVCDGQSYDLAVHPDPTGAAILTLFENDIRPIDSGTSRMTVRHIGQQGPADFHIMPSGENPGVGGLDTVVTLDNTEERTFDSVVVNDYAMEVYNPGTTTGIITQNGDVEQEGGSLLVTYMMGSPPENDPGGAFMPTYGYEPPTTYTPQAPGTCGDNTGGGDNGGGGGDGGTTETGSVVPISGERLVETRSGSNFSTVDGQFEGIGRLEAGSTTEVQIAGRGSVPADAEGAFLNLAAIRPDGNGYVTVWDCEGSAPNSSNINYRPGGVTSNGALVELSSSGSVCIFTDTATDLIVDATGSLPAGSPIMPLSGERLVESRSGAGFETIDGQLEGFGRLAAGSTTEFQIAGRGSVPADADGAFLNFAAILPSALGHLTVWDCEGNPPNSSLLNYVPDRVTSNEAVVDLSDRGTICVYTVAETHLIVDANGVIPPEAGVTPLSAERLFETRSGSDFATIDGEFDGVGRLAAGSTTEVQIAGRGSVPGDAEGAFLNIAAIRPDGQGHVTVWDCEGSVPNSSLLNYEPGRVTANGALVDLSPSGTVCVYTVVGTDLIIDVTGTVPG